jgi:Fe-S cluster assembly iron-binding protein IscA
MEVEVRYVIRIDISMDAADKIREMLEEAGNDQLAARIFCVPG